MDKVGKAMNGTIFSPTTAASYSHRPLPLVGDYTEDRAECEISNMLILDARAGQATQSASCTYRRTSPERTTLSIK